MFSLSLQNVRFFSIPTPHCVDFQIKSFSQFSLFSYFGDFWMTVSRWKMVVSRFEKKHFEAWSFQSWKLLVKHLLKLQVPCNPGLFTPPLGGAFSPSFKFQVFIYVCLVQPSIQIDQRWLVVNCSGGSVVNSQNKHFEGSVQTCMFFPSMF